MEETGLLTTQEVAQLLELSDSVVRRLRIGGKLTGISRGGTWFFRRSDIEAFKRARDKRREEQASKKQAG
jgi:excisionase family DNA binding protein